MILTLETGRILTIIMNLKNRRFQFSPKKSGAVAITEINKVQSISDNRINSATRSLMTKYEMPSLLGKNLDYSKELTINEGMKCLFDIIPYEYGNENVYEKLYVLVSASQFSKAGTNTRTDAAIYAAVKVLSSKTRTDVKGYASLQDFENLIQMFGNHIKMQWHLQWQTE